MPDDERFVVSYTPGQDLLVTWAINNGSVGEQPDRVRPTCTAPPTDPPASTTTSTTTTTTSRSRRRRPPPGARRPPPPPAAPRRSRRATRPSRSWLSIKPQLTTLKLDVPGVQLVGTYPIEGTADDDVVQVLYTKATVQAGIGDYKKAFDVPPAEAVQCLNPAFELS